MLETSISCMAGQISPGDFHLRMHRAVWHLARARRRWTVRSWWCQPWMAPCRRRVSTSCSRARLGSPAWSATSTRCACFSTGPHMRASGRRRQLGLATSTMLACFGTAPHMRTPGRRCQPGLLLPQGAPVLAQPPTCARQVGVASLVCYLNKARPCPGTHHSFVPQASVVPSGQSKLHGRMTSLSNLHRRSCRRLDVRLQGVSPDQTLSRPVAGGRGGQRKFD